MTRQKPPLLLGGGVLVADRVRLRKALPPHPLFVDLPCSMLVRDLAAVCSGRWSKLGDAYILDGPKGSKAVVEGSKAASVVQTLSWAGPKTLQVFATLVELWRLDTGGRDPDVPAHRSIADIAAWMQRENGVPSARDRENVAATVAALANLQFVVGPAARTMRKDPPGPPIRLSDPLLDDHPGPVFAPGAEWVRALRGPGIQVAKLPRAVLGMHARNERYKILLSFYLAIMLRVNRKYGYHYRVNLRTLLDGAGIPIPDRNVSRFISAIYNAFDEMPSIRWKGPAYALYAAEEILDSKFTFSPSHELIVAYGDGNGLGVQKS